MVELRVGADAIETAAPAGEGGDGDDAAGGSDFADGVVAGVGDEKIADGVKRKALRIVELRGGAVAIGAAGDEVGSGDGG